MPLGVDVQRPTYHPPSFLPATCRVEVHADGDALDPLNNDAISECSDLEAEIGLSVQLQMAAILAFSFIWSIGAFVPFRWVHTSCSPASSAYYYKMCHCFMTEPVLPFHPYDCDSPSSLCVQPGSDMPRRCWCHSSIMYLIT